jgi:AraC-like DNA-binding protein
MDVLSDVIAAMRIGRPHSSRTEKRSPWGGWFHAVDGAGFHVVLSGTCWLIPAENEPIVLGVGDVVFLPHGRGHGLADSPSTPLEEFTPVSLTEVRPTRDQPGPNAPPRDGSGAPTILLCGAYHLDRARSHPLMDDLPEIVHLPAQLGRHPPLRAAVGLLAGEVEQPGPGSDAVVPALLDVLLLLILRTWFDEQSERHPVPGWATALNDPVIGTALRSIHRDPGRQWTVAELGAQGGLSRAAFARRFTDLVGQPPLSYLTWWRLTTGARLLRTSEAPLSAVATQVGYTSEYAFANAFKREYGIAPGKYRKAREETPSTGGGPWSPVRPRLHGTGRL